MKADLTRETFQREKRYSRVVQQQGRVPLDADWNEQSAIQQHRVETEAVDVIGQAGFPEGSSFELSASPDHLDVVIGEGTGYVDGILVENQTPKVELLAFTAPNQLQLRTLVIEGVPLRVGDRVLIENPANLGLYLQRIKALDPSTQTITLSGSLPAGLAVANARLKHQVSYVSQPDWQQPDFVGPVGQLGLPALNKDGSYLVYLDVWRRHVTALEDPALREVALGGPDTCTREKTVWQVRLAPIAQGQPVDCSTPLPTETSTGRLSARARKPAATDTPCVIQPSGRYRSLENQLYRVEIHDRGPLGTATFKLSRDNGMVMVSWLASNVADLTVSSVGRDKVLGFASGQWIELLDDTCEQSQKPGTLIKIKSVDPLTNTITVEPKTSYPANSFDIAQFPVNPRVRRWDHVSATAAVTVTRPQDNDGFLDLEQGVQVRFEDGYYVTGDYWLVPARTVTADVEWPRNEKGDPLPQPRRGVEHHFARLGVVTIANGAVTDVKDCRSTFRPLTDPLPPSPPPPPVVVADCCCGIQIKPTDNAQAVIDKAITQVGSQNLTGLTIEFAAGTYHFDAPLRIAAPEDGGGHLTIRGCGWSTQLWASNSENVLRIVGWQSVTVTDLMAGAGSSGTGTGIKGRPDEEPPLPADLDRHLLGVIYIHHCGVVRAERLDLTCAAAPVRRASCLTVWNANPGIAVASANGQSWVRDCRFHVGHMQVGVLIVNQQRVTVQDNVVDSYALDQSAIDQIMKSAAYIARYRRLIANQVMLVASNRDYIEVDGYCKPARFFAVGEEKVRYAVDQALTDAWDPVLATEKQHVFGFLLKPPLPANDPVLARKKRELKVRDRFHKLANRLLAAALDPKVKTTLKPAQLKPFVEWLAVLRQAFVPTPSAGIVVAGQRADDVRVLDNTVLGALDGIHIGLSHSGKRREARDVAGRVQVVGNSVAVNVPADLQRGIYHGVFVGNGKSVAVKRNYVTVQFARVPRPSVHGVAVWGDEGPVVIVAENDIRDATVGINMHLETKSSGKQQWQAASNSTYGCAVNIVTLKHPGDANAPVVLESGNLP